MKKNILFFTALKANDPNMMAYKEWSLKTWEYYAKRHNCEIFILEDPLYDTEWMRPTWQRWYVYDLLEVNNNWKGISIDYGDHNQRKIEDLRISTKIQNNKKFDIIVLSVAHKIFSKINPLKLITKSGFVYDIKSFYKKHPKIYRL